MSFVFCQIYLNLIEYKDIQTLSLKHNFHLDKTTLIYPQGDLVFK